MKKLIPLFVVLLVVVFMTPALASEVDSTVTVRELFAKADLVLKAKATLELKVITDIYTTRIDQWFNPDSRAMAEVVKKQINEDNTFCVFLASYSDKIEKSFNDGFKGINQASGSLNNQGNIVSAAVTDKRDAWANAEVIDYQLNDRLIVNDPKVATDPLSYSTALIDGSFNDGFTGVAQVNQSPGFANNQNNIVAIAFSSNGAKVAEADVNLDQINVYNTVTDVLVCRTNTVNDSFNGGFRGIAQVNQSAGNFNNQANIVAFAGTK
jgi:hypothetical protein